MLPNFNRLTRFIADWFLLDGTQAYILSYPKSGRTWLRALLGKALCDHYLLPEDELIDTYHLTHEAGLPGTRFSHDRTHLLVGLPYQWLPRHKRAYRNRQVLLLLRDPRDLIVSCYFQATKRIKVFRGTISDFIRSPRYGIEKYVRWANVWYAERNIPRAFLMLTYEDLHRAPHRSLRLTLDFLEARSVTDETVHAAVEYANFQNLKKLEKSDRFQSDVLRPSDSADPESFKVRKGQVGGYTEYLNESDVDYIDGVVRDRGCPYLKAYYE